MDGVYLTWLISALAVGVFLMPYFKPPWAKRARRVQSNNRRPSGPG